MSPDVVVTGFGVLTAFGRGEQALLDGVFSGSPAFAEVTRFDVSERRRRYAAVYPKADDRSQTDVLVDCVRDALTMAKLPPGTDTPFVVGTKGDFFAIHRFWGAEQRPTPEETAQSIPGHIARRVAEAVGLSVPGMAFTNACVASTNAIIHAARLVASGRVDTIVCAGAYLVDPEVFVKFDSVLALAGDGHMRPFAVDRSGFLLGDGVGAIVVETPSAARARGATPLASLTGWGMAGDAHHVVHPHPEGHGMAEAIKIALQRADLKATDLDYINVHGTGTPLNDRSESRALYRALGEYGARVPVSSTKSTMGHALEASGIVEAIICITALRYGMAPPTAGMTQQDPACNVNCVVGEAVPLPLRRVLTTNASFGGINAALILEGTGM